MILHIQAIQIMSNIIKKVIRTIYVGISNSIRIQDGKIGGFSITPGFYQSSTINSYLFILTLDLLTELIRVSTKMYDIWQMIQYYLKSRMKI